MWQVTLPHLSAPLLVTCPPCSTRHPRSLLCPHQLNKLRHLGEAMRRHTRRPLGRCTVPTPAAPAGPPLPPLPLFRAQGLAVSGSTWLHGCRCRGRLHAAAVPQTALQSHGRSAAKYQRSPPFLALRPLDVAVPRPPHPPTPHPHPAAAHLPQRGRHMREGRKGAQSLKVVAQRQRHFRLVVVVGVQLRPGLRCVWGVCGVCGGRGAQE